MSKKKAKKKKSPKADSKKQLDKAIDETIENMDLYTCDVSDDNVFYCANGETFKNIVDLGNSLSEMDEETFSSHVNEEKNDFANWIYDSVGDVLLAETLRELSELEDTKREVKVRIEFLEGS